MMISTKGRYAIRTMIELAKDNDNSFKPLHVIATNQDISKKYLEAIVKILITNQLIEGVSGKGGGYRLSRPAKDYTLSEILECAEGSLVTVKCVCNEDSCEKKADCYTYPVWNGLQLLIDNYLKNFTLADIMDKDVINAKVMEQLKGEK